jgi:hypothetical protein
VLHESLALPAALLASVALVLIGYFVGRSHRIAKATRRQLTGTRAFSDLRVGVFHDEIARWKGRVGRKLAAVLPYYSPEKQVLTIMLCFDGGGREQLGPWALAPDEYERLQKRREASL